MKVLPADRQFISKSMKGETLMKHKALNQLLCAATVNGQFREVLLRNPAQAIATGYFGHSFSLTTEEQELVIGIQAQRLEDFAAQVYHWISGNGNGHNGHNGNGKNGNGHGHDILASGEQMVDLYRAPMPVHA
jgi:hypothetical protein